MMLLITSAGLVFPPMWNFKYSDGVGPPCVSQTHAQDPGAYDFPPPLTQAVGIVHPAFLLLACSVGRAYSTDFSLCPAFTLLLEASYYCICQVITHPLPF